MKYEFELTLKRDGIEIAKVSTSSVEGLHMQIDKIISAKEEDEKQINKDLDEWELQKIKKKDYGK